jgi:polar amino acid transport system permease protein
MSGWERFVETFFKPAMLAQYWPDILKGVSVTVEIAAAVVLTGLTLGLLLASLRAYRIQPINWLIVVFVDVFRALPPLVAILLIYFGFPSVGINLPSFVVLWLVLSLVLAAFAEEIFWAGITSTPKGQWEAARSTVSPSPPRWRTSSCRRRSGSPYLPSPTARSPLPRTPRWAR